MNSKRKLTVILRQTVRTDSNSTPFISVADIHTFRQGPQDRHLHEEQ